MANVPCFQGDGDDLCFDEPLIYEPENDEAPMYSNDLLSAVDELILCLPF